MRRRHGGHPPAVIGAKSVRIFRRKGQRLLVCIIRTSQPTDEMRNRAFAARFGLRAGPEMEQS